MSEVKEEIKETPDGTLEQGEFKVKKKKPKKLTNKKSNTIKVDLTKKEEKEDAVQEQNTGVVDEDKQTTNVEEVEKRTSQPDSQATTEESKEEVVTVIEEIKAEEQEEVKEVVEQIKEEIKENPQLELPENVEKLVSFMKETGGTVEDYVKLNKDYSTFNNEELLRHYYSQTKPHLNSEEISFLMEDQFSWDEEVDEDRAIRKKKLDLKEEIAKAQNFLESSKSKYYADIKLRPGITQEQQKATDFFNRYNEEQQLIQQRHDAFKNTTNNYFNEDFKGFDFKLNEKQFRYKVTNPTDVGSKQSDLNNFIGKFLDKNGAIKDHAGYHKALYTARNADTIANHFYEQGKTDAIKDMMAKSKNITNEIRPTSNGELFINGLKVRAISGVDSSKLKVKTKNKN